MSESAEVATARRYLAALERGAPAEDVAAFFTPDVVVEILPSRLDPKGSRRGPAELRATAELGRTLLARQSYLIDNVVAAGDQVAMELRWEGELAVQAGAIAAGTVLRARVAMWLRFENGRIAFQRNYDSYEAWAS